MRKILTLLSVVVLSACSTSTTTTAPDPMNAASERYVKLVLALGEHDTDYVDAYYGPPEWRDEVKAAKRSVDAIHDAAVALDKELRAMPKPADEMLALRREYLARQTEALIARAEMLKGRKMTFDEESKALYDAVAPHHDEAYFEQLTADLDKELPGAGSLADRIDAFKHDFIIPKDKLDAVFKRAIEGCRSRTLQQMTLPPGETFTIEYVTNKSWSGYNWYQGNFHSLIQVNPALPIYIDRAIDLACHEGYPGHHVYNALLEQHLVRERGWIEFTIYPLFSPQSLIAEGTANYGIEVAFPGDERAAFERDVLYPEAGLDPAQATAYARVQALVDRVSYAGNEAARKYLNGAFDRKQATAWLAQYAMTSPVRAEQRTRFFDTYRSYV